MRLLFIEFGQTRQSLVDRNNIKLGLRGHILGLAQGDTEDAIDEFMTNDAVKDAANASTPLEKAMAESLFMNPLLCLACLLGGGAMLFRRTTPLGIAI